MAPGAQPIKKKFRKIPKGREQRRCRGARRREFDAGGSGGLGGGSMKAFYAGGELMLGPSNPYGLVLCARQRWRPVSGSTSVEAARGAYTGL